MLILTRRLDESLCIGPDIRITVLGIKGQQVRLGIRAPKDVIVDREEVHVRKQLAPAGGISPDTALAQPAGGISSNTAPAPPAAGAR